MSFPENLTAHLGTGTTTLARVWKIIRSDGFELGFTDHDVDLHFDGLVFRADSGMTAKMLQMSSGLSVDNSEALGALRSDLISDADIKAGRYDNASVTIWLVNWQDVSQRHVLFCGTIGEIVREAGTFRAELRGLTENLNKPTGRIFQVSCDAALGDTRCRFDMDTAGYRWAGSIVDIDSDDGSICLGAGNGFVENWFLRGVLRLTSGSGVGLKQFVKRDELIGGQRWVTPWVPFGVEINPADEFEITAGCDRRFQSCRDKFNNVLNFRGFPDLPSDDWVLVHPASRAEGTGGSRR